MYIIKPIMVLEKSKRETSHSRNVCIIESVLEQRLQWSSLAILNLLSSFLVMIILCNILNKNCLSLSMTSLFVLHLHAFKFTLWICISLKPKQMRSEFLVKLKANSKNSYESI